MLLQNTKTFSEKPGSYAIRVYHKLSFLAANKSEGKKKFLNVQQKEKPLIFFSLNVSKVTIVTVFSPQIPSAFSSEIALFSYVFLNEILVF